MIIGYIEQGETSKIGHRTKGEDTFEFLAREQYLLSTE